MLLYITNKYFVKRVLCSECNFNVDLVWAV